MWKSTIMISFDYGNTQELRKKYVDKLGSTIPKHRICQTYIYIYSSRKDETNHRNNIADYNYFALDGVYTCVFVWVNRPFNFQNTSLRPRLQINRPMVKRARIGIYRIQSSLRNEILPAPIHPLVAGEKERIQRGNIRPTTRPHPSIVFVASAY